MYKAFMWFRKAGGRRDCRLNGIRTRNISTRIIGEDSIYLIRASACAADSVLRRAQSIFIVIIYWLVRGPIVAIGMCGGVIRLASDKELGPHTDRYAAEWP